MTSTRTGADGGWTAQFAATRSWDVRAIWNDVASPRTRVVVAADALGGGSASRASAPGAARSSAACVRPQKPSVLVEAWRQATPTSTRYVRAFTLRCRAQGRALPRGGPAARGPASTACACASPATGATAPVQSPDLFVRAVRRAASGGTGGRAGR